LSTTSAPSPAGTLSAFNGLDAAACVRVLRACLDVPAWVAAVRDGRPYPSRDALLAAATAAGDGLSSAEVRGALAQHPRIGERPTADTPTARFSRAEQAGVAAGAAERLRVANATYEDRFGHIFLIRAAGRDAEEILAELSRRLRNSPEQELGEVRGQLTEIAALRLASAVSPG